MQFLELRARDMPEQRERRPDLLFARASKQATLQSTDELRVVQRLDDLVRRALHDHVVGPCALGREHGAHQRATVTGDDGPFNKDMGSKSLR